MNDPRWQPSWRKPIGILTLLVFMAVYTVIAVTVAGPVSRWPALAQMPVWLVLGVAWLLPLRRFLIWMETGRWR